MQCVRSEKVFCKNIDGLAVVVHLAAPVRQLLEPKVLHHVPHRDAEARVFEPLALVEPLAARAAALLAVAARLAVLVVVVGFAEDHGHFHFARKAGGVHVALVVERAAAHHERAHERHHAEDFHEVLGRGATLRVRRME